MEKKSPATPSASRLQCENRTTAGNMVVCTNLVKGGDSICTVFHRSYKPSQSQVRDFCDNENHRNCPFYMKGTWERSVASFEKNGLFLIRKTDKKAGAE